MNFPGQGFCLKSIRFGVYGAILRFISGFDSPVSDMKKLFLVLCVPGLFVSSAGASPLEKGQIQAVKEMGNLNGVALNCRFFDQAKRIKQIMIDNLPKQRELGQIFEDETNASFLRFTRAAKPCPSPVEFAEHVGEAEEALKQAFPVN